MGKPGLVIFDCDGVLVDTERAAFEVSSSMAAEIGISLMFSEHERYFGMRDSDMFSDLARRHEIVLPNGFLESLEDRKMARYREGVSLLPGAVHAVRRIADSKMSLCVASSATLARTQVKLEPVGLLGYFDAHIFTAYDVPNGKPAPDLFLYAASAMGFVAEECVVIEDSLAGVQGAMEAGMRVFGYAPNGDKKRLSDMGAEVFVSMADVPGMLGL